MGLFSKSSSNSTELSSPENVKKGQQVYSRIVAGEVKAKDVKAELDRAYGRGSKKR